MIITLVKLLRGTVGKGAAEKYVGSIMQGNVVSPNHIGQVMDTGLTASMTTARIYQRITVN